MPKPPTQTSSKIGGLKTLGNRAIAAVLAPSENIAAQRSEATTYFTKVPQPGEPSTVLYSADRLWTRVKLTLETAGPVAVGFKSQISPVLTGKGQLLETGKEMVFDVAKGNRLYIAATAVNRVKFTTEPLPWFEQIVAILMRLGGGK